jgi:hypothetical protein
MDEILSQFVNYGAGWLLSAVIVIGIGYGIFRLLPQFLKLYEEDLQLKGRTIEVLNRTIILLEKIERIIDKK